MSEKNKRRINPNVKLYAEYKDCLSITANALDTSMSSLAESIFKHTILNNSDLKFNGESVHETFNNTLYHDFYEFSKFVRAKISPLITYNGYSDFTSKTFEEFKTNYNDVLEDLEESDPTIIADIDFVSEQHEEFMEQKFETCIYEAMDEFMKDTEYVSGWSIFKSFVPTEFKNLIQELENARRAAHAGVMKQCDANFIIFISKLIYEDKILSLVSDYPKVQTITQIIDNYMQENTRSNPYFTFHRLIYEWEHVNGNKISIDDHQRVKKFVEDFFIKNHHNSTMYKEFGEILNRVKLALNKN